MGGKCADYEERDGEVMALIYALVKKLPSDFSHIKGSLQQLIIALA